MLQSWSTNALENMGSFMLSSLDDASLVIYNIFGASMKKEEGPKDLNILFKASKGKTNSYKETT
jgi:hypothetical protein